jgi:hypothetical protein
LEMSCTDAPLGHSSISSEKFAVFNDQASNLVDPDLAFFTCFEYFKARIVCLFFGRR